jgi:predicted dehydrogenase
VLLNKNLLLIGFGSIGLAHFKKASNFFNDITVVDIDKTKEQEVTSIGKLMEIKTRFLRSTDQLGNHETFDLIVIANWGPDHMKTYDKVSRLSSNFLIEKPLVSSLKDLLKLKVESTKGKLIITNHQWLYSGFKERVFKLQSEFNLGSLSGVHVFGGSRCIVTNGIHFLAISSQLLNQYPFSVVSLMNSLRINPRRNDFEYYGGVAVWNYHSGPYLSVHFQLASNVSETLKILFENGYIEIIDGNMQVNSIAAEDLGKLLKPSWTFRPSVKSEVFKSFAQFNGSDGLDEIYRRFVNNAHSEHDFEPGYQATLGILAGLKSTKDGKVIRISEFEHSSDDVSELDWNIT